MFKKSKTKSEPFCKNCLLYDFEKRHCKVVVLYQGEKLNPPTEPEDACIFNTPLTVVNEKGETEQWIPEVEEVKWWCEDENGNHAEHGKVKIEFPKNFFGDDNVSPI